MKDRNGDLPFSVMRDEICRTTVRSPGRWTRCMSIKRGHEVESSVADE